MRQSCSAPGSGASGPSDRCMAVASLTLAGENRRISSKSITPKMGLSRGRRIRLPASICACPPVGTSSISIVRSIGNHLSTGSLSLHSPENNHVASVLSHSNTRPAHPKAAIRIPSSAGPIHPMVSVPSSMIASRLLARIGVATLRAARGVGEGGTSRVEVGQGVAVSCGSAPASQSAASGACSVGADA